MYFIRMTHVTCILHLPYDHNVLMHLTDLFYFVKIIISHTEIRENKCCLWSACTLCSVYTTANIEAMGYNCDLLDVDFIHSLRKWWINRC